MKAALRELLDGSLDFAGLYPPARLPLAEAVSRYIALAESPDQWIVNRFVCPAGQLEDFEAELDSQGIAQSDFPVAVVGTGLSSFDHDLESMEAVATSPLMKLETFEIALTQGDSIRRLGRYGGRLDELGVGLFVELAWGERMSETMVDLESSLEDVGYKALCGGAEIPSAEQLARFITEATELGAPMKFSRGLHNLLPSGAEHGLLNVLLGAALAHATDFPARILAELLSEKDGAAFEIDAESLRWRDEELALPDIREFWGFCSGVAVANVRPALDQLQALGWS